MQKPTLATALIMLLAAASFVLALILEHVVR